MADSSFDVVSKVDRQEVDNALQQAAKELSQRYDFRGTDAAIRLDDDYVSTRHGQVTVRPDGIIVAEDLGSTNGSTILRVDGSRENLVPETPTVLPAGARLTLGDRTLSVERVQ